MPLFVAATKTLIIFERTGGGADGVDPFTFNIWADEALVDTADRVYFNALLSRIWYGQRGNGSAGWKGTIYCAMGLSRLFTAGERTTLLTLKDSGTFG